ncbi:MAG TPA: PIN domain-containing protein [Chthoniobacterales bacterium]|nr:PIN domain-containing protein [Chthoniobacterales bacterium]
MKIIVDTSVWSLALRRRQGSEEASVKALRELIADGLIVMLGCIRQEILSGVRSREQFRILRDHLRAFRDETLQRDDYERAAEFFNDCRREGIQGSNTDFLICAAAANRGHAIFTTDHDFQRFRKAIDITLFSPR